MKVINLCHKMKKSHQLPKIGWLLVILICNCFNIVGQQTKKQLTKEDYALWGRLQIQELSNKGNWVSYTMIYSENSDTLVIQNTQNKQSFKVPDGRKGQFIGEEWFTYFEPKNIMKLLNLKNGKSHIIYDIKSVVVAKKENHLLLLSQPIGKEQELIALNLNDFTSKKWSKVMNYKYNPFIQTIAISKFNNNQNELILAKLSGNAPETLIETSSTDTYTELTWQFNGRNLVYLKGDKTICYYNGSSKNSKELNLENTSFYTENHKLTLNGSLPLILSKDGNRVFFGFQQKIVESKKDTPEIWNTYDRWIYPENKEVEGWIHLPKIGCWIPKNDQAIALTDKSLPKGYLNGHQNYLLTYNPMTNEPQFKKEAPLDIYVQNIGHRTKSLFLEKYPFSPFEFHLSPCGQYAFYFKEGDWFSYSFAEDKHRNLTSKINVSFDFESYDMSDSPSAYGFGGWTKDNQALIYDKYDIWRLTGDGKMSKKLTQGRTSETCFRLQNRYKENEDYNYYNRFEKGVYDLSKGLLFTIEKKTTKGFATWSTTEGVIFREKKAKRFEQIKKANQANRYVYTEEHFNEPPKIIFLDIKNNLKKVIVESNPQNKEFDWGFSKQITYTDAKGNKLKGTLYYPASYKPDKKYPMIVRIYEIYSNTYDRYIIPTDYNTSGFNITNLTTQGFFVLQPDIAYEIGNPGISASDCVMAAVDEALNSASIDDNKIGLIGHSFGGYETLFILTQTNRFAAAVASGAISDIAAMYLYIDGTIDKTNYWRFENSQFRMGKSLFENREGYARNSPLSNVEKINTPLLTWSGLNDLLVNPSQTHSLYTALRRLKRKNVMLMYEGERHVLLNKNNQKDLTQRVENWFNHHLKGKEEMQWMQPQN